MSLSLHSISEYKSETFSAPVNYQVRKCKRRQPKMSRDISMDKSSSDGEVVDSWQVINKEISQRDNEILSLKERIRKQQEEHKNEIQRLDQEHTDSTNSLKAEIHRLAQALRKLEKNRS